MFGDNLERIVAAIEKNHRRRDLLHQARPPLPNRTAIKDPNHRVAACCSPGYFGAGDAVAFHEPQLLHRSTLIDIESVLRQQHFGAHLHLR